MTFSTALSSLALAAAALAGAAPAHADMFAPRTVAVHYGDLDLATASGQARIDRRIRYAAATVCGPAMPQDLPLTRAVGACRTDTVADAQAQLAMVVAAAERRGDTRLAQAGGSIAVSRR